MPSPSRLWRRLRPLLSPKEPLPEDRAEGPASSELPWAPGGANTIQDLLDREGLPWRLNRRELIERFGETSHPAYRRAQIPITPAPFGLSGLIYPVSPDVHTMPRPDDAPLSFSGSIWIGRDPMANLRHAHAQIAAKLGPAPIIRASNTVFSRWTAGPAQLSLTIWPKELQTYPTRNDAHARDKRLKTACSISIETGYRRKMSEQESAWLRSAAPLAEIRGAKAPTLTALWASQPTSGNREFMREPPAESGDFLGRISLSADGAALIICAWQLHIVPVARIEALQLQKVRPARGGGGAYLSLVFQPMGSDRESCLTLSDAFAEMDALDDLAARLGEALDRPVRIPEPTLDC
ncbi:MAG: hypothetical protein ACK5MQ_18550 [Pikeienuella sp.]